MNEPKIFTFPGMIAKVYIPILSEEERSRGIERIRKAAENLLKSKGETT